MEYEIEDRPQMGETAEYEYLVTRAEFMAGHSRQRRSQDQQLDCAVRIPEQEPCA